MVRHSVYQESFSCRIPQPRQRTHLFYHRYNMVLLTNLKAAMRELRAVPPRYQTRSNTYVSKDLSTCTHVFVRNDTVRKPLRPPYDGPFKVIDRAAKYFTLDLNGRKDSLARSVETGILGHSS